MEEDSPGRASWATCYVDSEFAERLSLVNERGCPEVLEDTMHDAVMSLFRKHPDLLEDETVKHAVLNFAEVTLLLRLDAKG